MKGYFTIPYSYLTNNNLADDLDDPDGRVVFVARPVTGAHRNTVQRPRTGIVSLNAPRIAFET